MSVAVFICPEMLGGCGFVDSADWESIPEEISHICPKCRKVGRVLNDSNVGPWANRKN